MPQPRFNAGPAGASGQAGRPGHSAVEPTPATVTAVVDRVFTRFDGNSNTVLTQAEVLAVLDPNGTRTELATRLASAVTALDTDKDGGLSRAEISAAVKALDANSDGSLQRSELAALKAAATTPAIALFLHGHDHGGAAGATPAPKAITALVDLFFTRVDADTSGGVSTAELLAKAGRHLSDADAATKVAAVMTAFDTNKDAGLSKAEVNAAIVTIDTDKDGNISAAERMAAHGGTGDVELVGVLLLGHGHGHGHGDFGG